jgi:Lrp/AsnC family leucine-responsive transcriptional regulator
MDLELSRKDRTILYELDLNSRQPYSKLAKKLGMGKDALIARIKKLQEKGFIRGFITMINPNKFGLMSCRFLVTLQNTTPQIEKEIDTYLINTKQTPWIVRVEGNWNYEIWYLCESVNEANVFWEKFERKYGNYIEKMKFSIWMSVKYFGRAYLLDNKLSEIKEQLASGPQKLKISKIDYEILRLLVYNARIPIFEISQRLGISTKTVTKHIKRLEKEGVIVGYRLGFGLDKLGIQYFNIHLNLQNMDKKKEKEFQEYIYTHPNVIYDNVILGGEGFALSVQTFSHGDLRKLIQDLKKRFGRYIRKYFVVQFVEELKFSFMIPPAKRKMNMADSVLGAP